MAVKSKITVTIIVSILLIVILKLSLSKPKINRELVNEFWITKTHSNEKHDIVVCGDSRVYRGVSPNDITKELKTGLSAANFGYSSGGLSSHFLDCALTKLNPESKHKILIIGLTPHSLTKEALKNTQFNSLEKLDDFKRFKGIYLSKYLKHFAPYKLSNIFKNYTPNYIQEYKKEGWVASSYITPDSTHALESYQNTFSKYKVEDEDISHFLTKIIDIKNQGIEIIAYRPPTTKQMRMLEDTLSGFNETAIRKQLEEHGIHWVEFPDHEYDSYDGSHLHHAAARKLSSKLGQTINELFLEQE